MPGGWGGGVLPYKGIMGPCGQPGYVFQGFCLKQGIDFISFCLLTGYLFVDDKQPVHMFYELNYSKTFWVKCLKQGIKNRNSV